MAVNPLSYANQNGLRVTIGNASSRSAPDNSFSAVLKSRWPSPHTSTPKITTRGSMRIPIMYPGAKTIASSRISGGSHSMSFSLQYLMLQLQMQRENRIFTALSNIMKAKRDTAKNAIHNIR